MEHFFGARRTTIFIIRCYRLSASQRKVNEEKVALLHSFFHSIPFSLIDLTDHFSAFSRADNDDEKLLLFNLIFYHFDWRDSFIRLKALRLRRFRRLTWRKLRKNSDILPHSFNFFSFLSLSLFLLCSFFDGVWWVWKMYPASIIIYTFHRIIAREREKEGKIVTMKKKLYTFQANV